MLAISQLNEQETIVQLNNYSLMSFEDRQSEVDLGKDEHTIFICGRVLSISVFCDI